MEKLTYTHDAQAAAVIASVYQDAPPLAYVHSYGCQQFLWTLALACAKMWSRLT